MKINFFIKNDIESKIEMNEIQYSDFFFSEFEKSGTENEEVLQKSFK